MLLMGTQTNDASVPVTIDLPGLLHHTLIVGQSGSGKSFFVARLVEEILTRTRARVVVLDPNGDFSASSQVSESIWNRLEARFVGLSSLSRQLGLTDLDTRDTFSHAWSNRRFVYLHADQRYAPGLLLSESRVINRRLLIHWDDLDEERDFLLRADARVHPKIALGLTACQENLQWLRQNRPEMPADLEGLITVAEGFANKNISLHAYDYVKNLDVDDWNAVRARFFDLLKTYAMWWHQANAPREKRPNGLCDFLDQPFGDGPSARSSWSLLTLGLDSSSQADQLLSADVTLWRLWRNAKRAWRDRMRARSTAESLAPLVPTFIVVDEAHNFAPAAASDDPIRRRVEDRLIQVASEGRKYGLYLILATQRPTKLHPELVPECENSCVLRVQSAREQEVCREHPRHTGRPITHCCEVHPRARSPFRALGQRASAYRRHRSTGQIYCRWRRLGCVVDRSS